jgi:transcriptional regulator with XRE-family HTH domain
MSLSRETFQQRSRRTDPNRCLYSAKEDKRSVPQPPKTVVVSKKEVGARLRAIRQQRGKTQVELAKLLKVHQANISAMERGIRSLTIHQVLKLSRALQVSTDELLKGERPVAEKAPIQSLKLLRRMQLIQQLTPPAQRAILKFIDGLLQDRTLGNGKH